MTSLRIFTIGGAIAYRALFNWVSPWIYIPTLLGGPIFQILPVSPANPPWTSSSTSGTDSELS